MDKSDAQQKKVNEKSEELEGRNAIGDEDASNLNTHRQRVTETQSNYNRKQNRGSSKTRASTLQDEPMVSRSRSRSPSKVVTKRWNSSNAFINFVQDFRRWQDYTGIKGTKLFRMAGERWRKMSADEKEPYLTAAKTVRERKREEDVDQVTLTDANADEKKSKQTRKSAEKKATPEKKQGRKDKDNTDSDSESAASETSGTGTSEDLTDLSS